MVKVALTGNYGSGKSFILGIFRQLGALCISADEIVGELLERPDVLEKIRALAGDDVLEPAPEGGMRVRKQMLAELIFADADLRRSVEDVIHPLVLWRIEETVRNSDAKVAVVEIPLLFERGYEGMFDKTIAVYADEEIALGRLEKAGVNRRDAIKRLRVQMPPMEKVKKADYVINNQGTPEQTRWQVGRLYEAILASL